MSEQIQSKYNGLTFDKPAMLSGAEWATAKRDLRHTEGGHLFQEAAPRANEPTKASGKSFAMPQNSTVEFAADIAKREKVEAKAAIEDKPSKARGRPAKAVAAE
jgi:hypothetical protein